MAIRKAKIEYLTAKEILDSRDNMRGDKFDPQWTYILVKERGDQVNRMTRKGYRMLVEDIRDRYGRESAFCLMGRPRN